MEGIKDLKEKILEFQKGSDYDLSVNNQEEIYIIRSEKLKSSLRKTLSSYRGWQGNIRINSKMSQRGVSETYEITQGDKLATYYKPNEGYDEFRLIAGQVFSIPQEVEEIGSQVRQKLDEIASITEEVKKISDVVRSAGNLPNSSSWQNESENNFSRGSIIVQHPDNNSLRIQEITDQEAQQIQQQQNPIFPSKSN